MVGFRGQEIKKTSNDRVIRPLGIQIGKNSRKPADFSASGAVHHLIRVMQKIWCAKTRREGRAP